MLFIWPNLLPLLILVPILIAGYLWVLRRRSRFALRYSSLAIVKDVLGKGPRIRRHIPPFLFILEIAVVLIALARPYGVVTLPKQEATVILAIDVSGSMRAGDLKPSRIEAAKAAARAFVERQSASTSIGIVAFSDAAYIVQTPTTDRASAFAAINRLTLQRRTAIGSGILTSLDAIFEVDTAAKSPSSADSHLPVPNPTPTPVPKGTHVPAIVVLLTDGQSNTGPALLKAAEQAANRGVRVFTIGVGTVQGATLSDVSGVGFRTVLDEESLKRVAEITDAEYFKASDENALTAIYEHLDTQLIIRTERTELTAIFTALAATLLFISWMLSMVWFNRLP